jgi:spore protease
LALEARELWQESAERTTRLHGVKAVKQRQEGYPVTRVDILDPRGAEALGKPQGTYLTIDLTTFWQRKAGFFERAVRVVGSQLKALLPAEGAALVIGLGNSAMTPDAVGPLALDSVLITRHLISAMPRQFAGFRPVAAFRTGVLGTTGVESAEAVRGLVAEVQPALIIAASGCAPPSSSATPASSPAPAWGTTGGRWTGRRWGSPCLPWASPRWWTRPPWRRTCWRRRA